MKRIIVACANGVATSQAVASKVNRLLKERKVDAVVDAVNIKSLDRDIKDCVAYITISLHGIGSFRRIQAINAFLMHSGSVWGIATAYGSMGRAVGYSFSLSFMLSRKSPVT